MAVSNNFGEYLAKTYHGWFIARMKDLRTFINQAFVNAEGGLKRNTIPLFCVGGSAHVWSPIVIDSISAADAWIGAYQMNYGLGLWTIKAGAIIYALEGSTAKDYTLVVNIAAGGAFVLAWNPTAESLTISIPNDETGTLGGLRTALLANGTLRDMFAVSGEDATTLVAADVLTSTAITDPAAYGTGVAALLAMAEVYFERLEANWAKLYIPADATLGALDAFLPCTIHLEVWNDGQMMEFKHLATAAAAE